MLAEVLLDAGRSAPAGAALELMASGREDDLSASECRVVGRHRLAEGRTAEAMQSLRRGLDLAAVEPHRYEEGLLLLEVAAAHRSTGTPYVDELGRATEILAAMGVLVGEPPAAPVSRR